MARVFDVQSHIPLLSKLQRCLHIVRFGSIDNIDWIRPNRAASLSRVGIARHASPIWVDWIAAIICPDW